MKLSKFKLIDGGIGGISAAGTDLRNKGEYKVQIDINELKIKIPIPEDIIKEINKLKKFMLDAMGYWLPEMDKLLESGESWEIGSLELGIRHKAMDLLDNVKITGLVKNQEAYIITGHMTNHFGSVIGLSTPKLSYESTYPDWYAFQTVAIDVMAAVEEFINENKLRMMEPKQLMLALFADDKNREREIEELDNDTVNKMALEHLEGQGVICIPPENMLDEHEDVTDQLDELDEREEGKAAEEEEEEEVPDQVNKDGEMSLP